MKDFEVASALNIIAESHNSRAIMIDITNRVISFEGPEEHEVALSIAVSEFMESIKYIDIEPVIEPGIQQLTDKVSWDI